MVIDNKYQSFYTHSTPIVHRMVSELKLKENDHIFEPCGGDGVFVDKIIETATSPVIDICELNPEAYAILINKYKGFENIRVKQTDTLLDTDLTCNGEIYDKIIANPPYGAKTDKDRMSLLKNEYKGLYIKESYTLFLYRCIQLLKEGGRLVFIIPDTFLSLNRHIAIRQYILKYTKIIKLLLFPSSFFPNVNFGYANLSIIVLEKHTDENSNMLNEFPIYSNFDKVENINNSNFHPKVQQVRQGDIYNNISSSFLLHTTDKIRDLINSPSVIKIGDICSCVTGFYSGNDKRYLHVANKNIKNAKKYALAEECMIYTDEITAEQIIDGIDGPKYLVPIVKGGNIKYIKPNEWYMDWSINSMKEYKQSKKCRLQNSTFYFKRSGIAIPMIRSSQLTASLIQGRLFDQSIVGVFPKDKTLTTYLLAFFNSSICTTLISCINPSTNNSANYIKQIPILLPDKKVMNKITKLTNNIIINIEQRKSYGDIQQEIDGIFNEIYGM